MGFPVFYSDIEAKRIMLTDEKVTSQIKNIFGDKAYVNNDLNRNYLAEKIFTEPELKDQINAVIHPAVRKAFDDFAQNQKTSLVFNEAAILFETGSYKSFNATILVVADEELRIKRVQERDKVPVKSIIDRMNNQWSDEKKKPLADFIIENNEDSLLVPQVEKIIEQLH